MLTEWGSAVASAVQVSGLDIVQTGSWVADGDGQCDARLQGVRSSSPAVFIFGGRCGRKNGHKGTAIHFSRLLCRDNGSA